MADNIQFIDEAHKRRTIAYKGFDPDKYDVDVTTGNIVPKPEVGYTPPAINVANTPQPVLPTGQKPSVLKSAALGAATGVLPAAGGLGAAIAAQPIIAPIAAATGPAAPITEIVGSLVAGLGGAGAINWLQNKLLPDSANQAIAEAQQENPLSFLGGNLAGQLPVMAANPRGVVQAVKTGGKLLNNVIRPSVGQLPISLAEKANAINVGVGAAIPAGRIASDVIQGKEINPTEAALDIAGGLILNKPSRMANKLFNLPAHPEVKPPVSPEALKTLAKTVEGPNVTDLSTLGPILEDQYVNREISQGKIPEGYEAKYKLKPKPTNPLTDIENNILSPEFRTKLPAKGEMPERFKQRLPQSGVFKKLGIKQDVITQIPDRTAEASAEAMFGGNNTTIGLRAADRLATGGDNPQGETTFKTGQDALGLPKVKSPEQAKLERESNYNLYTKLIKDGKPAEAAKFASDLGETYYFGRRYTAEKTSGKTEEFAPTEEGKLTAADKQLLAERRKNFQGLNEEGTAPLTAEERLRANAEKAGNAPNIKATKEFFDTFNKIFGPLRNVKQSLNGRLINKETGQAVRGEIEQSRDGMAALLSQINPNHATPDTIPHEFVHGWFTDFKNSPNKYERESAVNLERAIKNIPEYISDNQRRVDAGKTPLSPEEYIAETGGYEVFNRAVNLSGNQGTIKQAWGDFISQLKLKLNKPSTQDIQNYVARRFINDPSFGERMANKYSGKSTQENIEQEDTANNQEIENEQRSGKNETKREAENNGAEEPIQQTNRAGENQSVKTGEEQVGKSDYEQYQEVQAKLKEQFAKGDFESPEFQKLWQESENIKNRNGGHVPKPTNKQEVDEPNFNLIKNNNKLEDDGIYVLYNKQKNQHSVTISSGVHTEAIQEDGSSIKISPQFLLKRLKPVFNNVTEGVVYGLKEGKIKVDSLMSNIHVDDFGTGNYEVVFDFKPNTKITEENLQELASLVRAKLSDISEWGDMSAIDEKTGLPNYQEIDENTKISRPAPQATKASDIRENINNTLSLPAFKKEGVINRNLKDLKARLPIFGSDLDKLATREGESGKYLAPSIKEALTKMDEYEGRYYNPSIENLKTLTYDNQKLLVDTLRAEHRTDKNLRDTLPEEVKPAYDIQREILKQKQEDQIAAGQKVDEYVRGPKGGFQLVKRLPKINPYYFPDIAGQKQLDIILNHEGSEAFDILKTDFINHIQNKYKFDDKTANEFFEDYKASFGGAHGGQGNATRFGAVRRAEGVGLPDSWLESDPLVTLRRYWRRVAKDRAWFDAVERDPNNLYILGYNKDNNGDLVVPTNDKLAKIPSNETLSGIIDTIQGVNIKMNPKIDAIARIANNLILGPLTGVNDVMSALPVVSKYIPSMFDAPKVYAEAIKNFSTGVKNAKSTGRIKEKISNIEDISYPSTELVERLRQIGDGVAKISGREKLEEFSRGLTQAAGEAIVKIHRAKAESGNSKSIKFLEELANKSDWKTMEDKQLASRIVDLTQGTYDVRGLPSWVINSQVAPMFRMMKWNIEQLNNLHKHVIVPALNGNLTPLMLTISTGLVGGYLSKELREAVNNKKLKVPKISEIINSTGSTTDKIHGATYAAAAAMSYSGVLGFLGEVLKSIADVSYKNKPNGFNFPAVEVVTDVVDNISDATQAMIQEGENPLKVIPELTKRLFSNNIQVGRLALNWLGDKEKIETQNAQRDLQVYKQQSGKDYQAQSIPSNVNPYVGMDTKKFQRMDNIKEMAPEASRLVKQAIADSKGNPGELAGKLNKLKAGAVTTFPSIDNAPAEFKQYYDYLVKQYGVVEAKRRVKEYATKRELNKVRRSLIPSI